MASSPVDSFVTSDYKAGFTTNVEAETLAPGLNEEVIRYISEKKQEPDWLTKWRLASFDSWKEMHQPNWGKLITCKIKN